MFGSGAGGGVDDSGGVVKSSDMVVSDDSCTEMVLSFYPFMIINSRAGAQLVSFGSGFSPFLT